MKVGDKIVSTITKCVFEIVEEESNNVVRAKLLSFADGRLSDYHGMIYVNLKDFQPFERKGKPHPLTSIFK